LNLRALPLTPRCLFTTTRPSLPKEGTSPNPNLPPHGGRLKMVARKPSPTGERLPVLVKSILNFITVLRASDDFLFYCTHRIVIRWMESRWAGRRATGAEFVRELASLFVKSRRHSAPRRRQFCPPRRHFRDFCDFGVTFSSLSRLSMFTE
jgi:hypothetical protein